MLFAFAFARKTLTHFVINVDRLVVLNTYPAWYLTYSMTLSVMVLSSVWKMRGESKAICLISL